MKIYKYPITQPKGLISIEMPAGAEVLTVQVQNEVPCIWALVGPDAPPTMRGFRMYGTGHEIDHENMPYVGTFQLVGGSLVFHLFEELTS